MIPKKSKIKAELFLCLFLSLALGIFSPAILEAYERKVSRALCHYITAAIFEANNDLDSAIYEYKQVLELDYSSATVHSKLAQVYIKISDFANAIKELNLAKKFDSENLEPYFLLTLIYSLQKKYDIAAEEYEKFLKLAIKLDPQNSQLYKNLGDIYFEQNNLAEAEKAYKLILELSPQDVRAHLLLGTIYEKQGKIKEATQEFKSAIAADPAEPIALNALGYLYAQQGINLDEARTLIEKALEFEPDNGAYWDSLGWVDFKKGDTDLAIEELEKAIKLLDDPIIYDHLGDAHYTKGNFQKAVKSWERSLELDATQITVKQKIEKLKLTHSATSPTLDIRDPEP